MCGTTRTSNLTSPRRWSRPPVATWSSTCWPTKELQCKMRSFERAPKSGKRLILNSTFSRQDFLRDLKQLILATQATLKPPALTASKLDLNNAMHSTDANLSNLLDSSSVNDKSTVDMSKSNTTMKRLDGVISNVAGGGGSSSFLDSFKKQKT